jgi:hypothetical protein
MFGFPIIIPVSKGIIQEFNDSEYHGHLSSKVVGKHIDELKDICKNRLYKSWVKNWSIAKVYAETRYNNIVFDIQAVKQKIAIFEKTTITRPSKSDYFYRVVSDKTFNERVENLSLNKKQAYILLRELEEKLKDAEDKINFAKLQVFNEHQTQF